MSEYAQTKKRNVFFSFHYADIMRVNNVRKSGEFKSAPSDIYGRNIEDFYDYSLWETKKRDSDAALKSFITDGVDRTSAVCVLIGTNTFQRRWVRYEIARSVIDGRGLLAVHINSLNHHQPPYLPHKRGYNPCACMGVYRGDNGKFYLAEYNYVGSNWKWERYQDYSLPVPVPKYMPAPNSSSVLKLSDFTTEYDWSQNGHQNIGGWIDMAAAEAGR